MTLKILGITAVAAAGVAAIAVAHAAAVRKGGMPALPNLPPAVAVGPAGKAEIPETVFDAGTVDRGADIHHDFAIKSTGDHDLTIDAKPGCGCTVVDYDKSLAPGRSGKIAAVVHTTNFKGPINKSITVTTNDPEHAHVTLTIKANVSVPIDISPSENVAFNGKADALAPQQLVMTSTDGQAFDVTTVTPSDDNFTVGVKAAPKEGSAPATKAGTVASGASRYEVTITPKKDIAIGRLASTITLVTTHPKASTEVIRIFGTVNGDVVMAPDFVTLATGAKATDDEKVQHVTVRKQEGEPLKILSVTADNPRVATAVKTVTPGREFDIEVKYAGEPTTAQLASKLTVKTNDPKQPTLEAQVWGRPDLPPGAGQSAVPVTVHPVQAAEHH